jgi:hypothetical protein
MSVIDQIVFRARVASVGISILQTATSLRDRQQAIRWERRLEPWLRTGNHRGSAYLDFGQQAAFIRWQAEAGSRLDWQYALVLVGDSIALTATHALELRKLTQAPAALGTSGFQLAPGQPGPRRDELKEQARSAPAVEALIPLLAHALHGEQRVTMPWNAPGHPDAVMWGLITILRMTGDRQPVSFLTYAPVSSRDGDTPGLLVSFRNDASAPLPPDQGYVQLATDLAHRFADDYEELRQALTRHGVPQAADASSRVRLLTSLPPRPRAGNAPIRETTTVAARPDEPRPPHWPAGPAEAAEGPPRPPAPARPVPPASERGPAVAPDQVVMCPMCLTEIPDWDALENWRWDPSLDEYVPIPLPPDLNRMQRAYRLHGAHVRCPGSDDDTQVVHYLPANYGRFGLPVLLGFVGLTRSGKTHLLTSMVGALGDLSQYGISVTPLDPATHQRFLDEFVQPLMRHNQVLPGTPEDVSTRFADAFIVKEDNGPERVVILIDVAGGDLARTDKTKQFLWIADGLFFVLDPDYITSSRAGDETFSNVLQVMRQRPVAKPVSASIILNKADKVRFEEPVARWLRSEGASLDPVEFLRESADVYAYLDAHSARVLAQPYHEFDKATLHVTSPTGGVGDSEEGVYPRGVKPLRVVPPLLAMLAMTGILTGPEADQVGV